MTSNCCQPNGAIYQLNPDGSDLQRLTDPPDPHNDGFPSAAPQGNRIALTSDRAYPDLCCADLFVMRGDGSGLHKVPTGDLNEVIDPDWGRATPDDAPPAEHAVTDEPPTSPTEAG